MADEYIKRNDLFVLSRDYSRQGGWEEAVPVRAIRNIPPADVAEVKRGEWCEFMDDPINQRNYGGQTGYYECSSCKFVEDYRPNFCPNCGSYNGGEHGT